MGSRDESEWGVHTVHPTDAEVARGPSGHADDVVAASAKATTVTGTGGGRQGGEADEMGTTAPLAGGQQAGPV